MSKSRGNIIDPWAVLDQPGRRRAALVLLLGRVAVDEPAGRRAGHRRVDPPVPADPVEHRVVLRHLRQPRRLVEPRPPGPGPPRPRPVGPVAVCTARSASRDRRRSRRFDALRAAQALDAFVDDLSNWYVRRSRPRFWKAADAARAGDAARVPGHADPAAGAVLPVHGRRAAPRRVAASARVGAPRPTGRTPTGSARRPGRSRRTWRSPAGWSPSGHAARNDAAIRVRQPLRRALVLLRRATRWTTTLAAQVADELNVKTARAGVRPSKGCSTTR